MLKPKRKALDEIKSWRFHKQQFALKEMRRRIRRLLNVGESASNAIFGSL